MTQSAKQERYRAGVPVYGYRTDPQTPPVSVLRLGEHVHPVPGQRHIHDFPVLLYIEQAVAAAAAGPGLPVRDGDAYVLAPGQVVDPAVVAPIGEGYAVFFDPVALGGDDRAPWPSWRTHPLLSPFLHDVPGGVLRLRVPPARRPVWAATMRAIGQELAERQEGHRQAALAHLTLLLVDVGRLAVDVVDDLHRSSEPLLAEVFDVIERRFAEPLSLREVAASVGMSPGHLTTVVRRRTGRTVVDWITERRMVHARSLLAGTDLPVAEIARRVGMPDPGYFARIFRRANGVSARVWRRESARDTPRPAAKSTGPRTRRTP